MEIGSIWRIWDLHVHTPASYEWSGAKFSNVTGQELNDLIRSTLESMNNSKAEAFAIMDYWTFDGYNLLKKYLQEHESFKFEKKIFPGMELRCEAPADYRLNIHVLLSDELTDQNLADFKSKLTLTLINRPLSEDGLADCARNLTDDKIRPYGSSQEEVRRDRATAIKVGSKVALIKRDSIYEAIESMPKNSALLMVPWEPYHGLESIDWKEHPMVVSEVMLRADIWETRKSAIINLFHGKKTEENKRYLENFFSSIGGKPRPAVSGSDAHSEKNYGVFPTNKEGERTTWIKSTLSFQGLLQTVNEPSNRVYIGKKPPQLEMIEKRPTYYISNVSVKKFSQSTLDEKWFDFEIPINPSMVSIIGNKGAGKSALLDIIGLLGNTKNSDHFSFLNADKFRNQKKNKSSHFIGTLTWADGKTNNQELSKNPESTTAELVKYIPQSYLEKICNEVDISNRSQFTEELEAVIFSHVPTENRLSFFSLKELIEHCRRETDDKIRDLRKELSEINREIVECERKASDAYKAKVQGDLELIQRKVEVKKEQKPKEVAMPATDPDDPGLRPLLESLAKCAEQKKKFETELDEEKNKISIYAVDLDRIRIAKETIENLKDQISSTEQKVNDSIGHLNVTFQDLFSFSISTEMLSGLSNDLSQKKKKSELLINPDNQEGVPAKIKTLETEYEELSSKLEGPNKAYQDYRAELEKWQQELNDLIGSEGQPDSLKFQEKMVADLPKVLSNLTGLKLNRKNKVEEIFNKISELSKRFEEFYAPVQAFSERHQLIAERFKPEFSVKFSAVTFYDKFISKINRQKAGSFYGSEDSEKAIKELISATQFSERDEAIAFVERIVDMLHLDYRTDELAKRKPEEQLKQNVSLSDLYDLISGLEYINLGYSLKLQGKELRALSPGERGALLLMFYLLVDKSEIPLLIDQPEENLDNQTVFSLIGECLKEAKQKRQIIIVTHNPNLAVACDSEQIICSTRDPDNQNKITYSCGAIENPRINKLLLDILEGTEPAFDNRDSKYQRKKNKYNPYYLL